MYLITNDYKDTYRTVSATDTKVGFSCRSRLLRGRISKMDLNAIKLVQYNNRLTYFKKGAKPATETTVAKRICEIIRTSSDLLEVIINDNS